MSLRSIYIYTVYFLGSSLDNIPCSVLLQLSVDKSEVRVSLRKRCEWCTSCGHCDFRSEWDFVRFSRACTVQLRLSTCGSAATRVLGYGLVSVVSNPDHSAVISRPQLLQVFKLSQNSRMFTYSRFGSFVLVCCCCLLTIVSKSCQQHAAVNQCSRAVSRHF